MVIINNLLLEKATDQKPRQSARALRLIKLD